VGALETVAWLVWRPRRWKLRDRPPGGYHGLLPHDQGVDWSLY